MPEPVSESELDTVWERATRFHVHASDVPRECADGRVWRVQEGEAPLWPEGVGWRSPATALRIWARQFLGQVRTNVSADKKSLTFQLFWTPVQERVLKGMGVEPGTLVAPVGSRARVGETLPMGEHVKVYADDDPTPPWERT